MANEFNDKFDDKDIKGALNAWRETAAKQSEREEWFWARQRTRIASRMDEPRHQHMPKLAWAGIAATLAVGAALMMPQHKQTQSNPPVAVKSTVQVQAQMTDHELMQRLEETMNSGVPDALQPASTLQQEMDQAYSSNVTGKVKESTK